MHFMHFADVIGCNSMLMLKVCKSFCKQWQTFGAFILARSAKVAERAIYFCFILFYM